MRPLLFLPLAVLLLLAGGFATALLLRGGDEAPASALQDGPLPPPVAAALAPLPAEPLLVNIFAEWCTPCLAEHPLLTALAPEVAIYGIAYRSPEADTRAWLAQHGDPFRRWALDENGALGVALGMTGVPETFVLDAAGRIRHRHVGPLTPDAAGELRALLATLRTEAP